MNADAKPICIPLPTGLGVGPVNVYLFTRPEPVLVDTGVNSDESWAALTTNLATHGLSIQDLHQVVISHPHVDHFGMAARILRNSHAAVLVSDLGVDWVVDFEKLWAGRQDFYRNILFPRAGIESDEVKALVGGFTDITHLAESVPRARVRPFSITASLQLGGAPWQVIHTPGHASTQTCFFQEETGQFLSADMLLPRTPTAIVEQPLEGKPYEPALPKFLESLDIVEKMEISDVYPGHGLPFDQHQDLISRQRARIHARKEECYTLVSAGYSTVYALLKIMYAHYPPSFRMPGLWMLIGYLDLLVAEGKVGVELVEGVWQYSKK